MVLGCRVHLDIASTALESQQGNVTRHRTRILVHSRSGSGRTRMERQCV